MTKPKVYLSDEQYKSVTNSVPIICVDMVLYDEQNKKIGFIQRGEKYALIGGRIGLNETIDEAVKRHLSNDLNINEFEYYNCSANNPILVHEYVKGEESPDEDKTGFDPTKHSIGLTYILITNQKPEPANEATGFKWTDKDGLEEIDFHFGQKSVAREFFSLV